MKVSSRRVGRGRCARDGRAAAHQATDPHPARGSHRSHRRRHLGRLGNGGGSSSSSTARRSAPRHRRRALPPLSLDATLPPLSSLPREAGGHMRHAALTTDSARGSSRVAPDCRHAALNSRRVEHDAARARDRAGRQVLAELCPHNAVVAVRTAHLPPDDAEFRVVHLLLRLVDVGDAFAEVELGVAALVDVLNLDERRVLVLVDLAPAREREAARRAQVRGQPKSAARRRRRASGACRHAAASGVASQATGCSSARARWLCQRRRQAHAPLVAEDAAFAVQRGGLALLDLRERSEGEQKANGVSDRRAAARGGGTAEAERCWKSGRAAATDHGNAFSKVAAVWPRDSGKAPLCSHTQSRDACAGVGKLWPWVSSPHCLPAGCHQ